MILYLLLESFNTILFFIISLFPTIETPVWLSTSLPQILRNIMGYNLYLPVYESIGCVVLVLSFTLGFRAFSLIANYFGLKL